MPVRAGALVLVDELGVGLRDVVAGGCDERLLVHPVLDTLPPPLERLAQGAEMVDDVVDDTEVDEREPGGRAALDLRDRVLPRLEVDVGRRARRHDEASTRQPHACGVSCVQRSVSVEVRDVVPRVAGRREAFEPESLVADDVHVRRGDRASSPQRTSKASP